MQKSSKLGHTCTIKHKISTQNNKICITRKSSVSQELYMYNTSFNKIYI